MVQDVISNLNLTPANYVPGDDQRKVHDHNDILGNAQAKCRSSIIAARKKQQ